MDDFLRQVKKLLKAQPAATVLSGLRKLRAPMAQFFVHAVADAASKGEVAAAVRALETLTMRGILGAGGPPRLRRLAAQPVAVAAAQRVLRERKGLVDDARPLLALLVCDGSAASAAVLAPFARRALAGENYDLESLLDWIEPLATSAPMRALATRLRDARIARLRKSPAGKINAIAGLPADAPPTRFSLWLDADGARLSILVNAPNGEWLDLTFSRGGSEFRQWGSKVSGRLRRPALRRLDDIPRFIASCGVTWNWDDARWNSPVRRPAFNRLYDWLRSAEAKPQERAPEKA